MATETVLGQPAHVVLMVVPVPGAAMRLPWLDATMQRPPFLWFQLALWDKIPGGCESLGFSQTHCLLTLGLLWDLEIGAWAPYCREELSHMYSYIYVHVYKDTRVSACMYVYLYRYIMHLFIYTGDILSSNFKLSFENTCHFCNDSTLNFPRLWVLIRLPSHKFSIFPGLFSHTLWSPSPWESSGDVICAYQTPSSSPPPAATWRASIPAVDSAITVALLGAKARRLGNWWLWLCGFPWETVWEGKLTLLTTWLSCL